MLARVSVLTVSLLVWCSAPARGADPVPVGRTFKVSITVDSTMTAGGRDEQMTGTTAYTYSWAADGKARVLRLADMTTKAEVGGRELMDMSMNRAGVRGNRLGQPVEIKFADAPEQLKEVLRDTFGAPLCKVERDENATELKRTVVAGPGAKTVIETGAVANATLFHPPYWAAKDEWSAGAEVSAGKGVASGPVSYAKVPGGRGGQAVKLSGTLKADGTKTDNETTIKGGVYKVSGQLVYDPEVKEWVSGQMDMDFTFRTFKGENEVGKAKGKLKAVFEMLPAKK